MNSVTEITASFLKKGLRSALLAFTAESWIGGLFEIGPENAQGDDKGKTRALGGLSSPFSLLNSHNVSLPHVL